MIQLRILSGSMAGTETVVRHFPFRVGRSVDCEMPIVEPGVWDHHATVRFERGDGFFIEAEGEALMMVNREAVQRARLRNGDQIELGGAVLQMWLDASPQKGLTFLEWLVWLACAALFGAQIWLIATLG